MFEALRAGAAGFLVKHTEPAELVRAVRVVAGGEALLSPSVTRRLIAEFTARPSRGETNPTAAWPMLTEREREVVVLVAQGLSQRGDRRRLGREPGHRAHPRQPGDDEAARAGPGPAGRHGVPERPGRDALSARTRTWRLDLHTRATTRRRWFPKLETMETETTGRHGRHPGRRADQGLRRPPGRRRARRRAAAWRRRRLHRPQRRRQDDDDGDAPRAWSGPPSGTGEVLGVPLDQPARYLPRVGALIEGPALYPGLTRRPRTSGCSPAHGRQGPVARSPSSSSSSASPAAATTGSRSTRSA